MTQEKFNNLIEIRKNIHKNWDKCLSDNPNYTKETHCKECLHKSKGKNCLDYIALEIFDILNKTQW